MKLATVLLLVNRDAEAEKEFDAVLASDVGNQVLFFVLYCFFLTKKINVGNQVNGTTYI